MKYNIKFEQDIKKIRLITDAKKRREAINMVAKSYDVSDKTIYRHMKKPVPSLSKVRSDAGKEKKPVTKKEVAIAAEIVKAGKSRQTLKKILPGMSAHKLSKISNKVKTAEVKEAPAQLTSKIREFFKEYFQLEYVSDSSVIPIKLGKKKIELMKEDFNDVVMILSNAFNRTAEDKNKLRLDRVQFMRSKLTQVLEDKIRIAKENASSEELERLMRMHQRIERKTDLTPNFKVVQKICRDLKPDISFDEIYSMVEKYSN